MSTAFVLVGLLACLVAMVAALYSNEMTVQAARRKELEKRLDEVVK